MPLKCHQKVCENFWEDMDRVIFLTWGFHLYIYSMGLPFGLIREKDWGFVVYTA